MSYRPTPIRIEEYIPRMVDDYIPIYLNPEKLKNNPNYLELREDINRTGILGEIAVSKLLLGGRAEDYLLKRPVFTADEGYDLVTPKGLRVDVKTQISSKPKWGMKWASYLCNLPEKMLKKNPDVYVWVVKHTDDDLNYWALGWLPKAEFEARATRHPKGSTSWVGGREFTYTIDTYDLRALFLNPMGKLK